MSARPTKCCPIGSYECQVPMPLNGRLQSIDYCIADVVAALNAANIRTAASCCGHGQIDGSVVLDDGREIQIKNGVRPWERKPLGMAASRAGAVQHRVDVPRRAGQGRV